MERSIKIRNNILVYAFSSGRTFFERILTVGEVVIALAAREKLAYSFGEALIALQIKTNININPDKKKSNKNKYLPHNTHSTMKRRHKRRAEEPNRYTNQTTNHKPNQLR